MSNLVIRASGDTNTGTVREANEDALIVDHKWGLYAVLDGMGGASAGDVASNKARDVIHEYVRARRATMPPRPLLEAAINAATAAVHAEATRRHDRKGMGTTVVACLIDGRRATVAHVGDSRAYLLREGRLHRLTNDHTIVAELVARGALSPDEAERHAYKNVLSRNLGGKPAVQVDVSEVELQAGDRLMLCSDGLYGYASTEAVHHLVASTDSPAEVVRDLIDAALRGGGGDNVTVIVVEAGVAAVPRATMVLRTTGAGSWWARRDRFLAAARTVGVHRSPLCALLPPDEAVALVAGHFADAIYHDLEKVTGVNVWTFAENLAQGWLGQGGAWPPLRDLLDGLARAAETVVTELRGEDPGLANLLEVAVARALVTAEAAVGGVIAERLRSVESELVRAETSRAARDGAGGEPRAFTEQPTIPFMRAATPPVKVPGPEVQSVLDAARGRALAKAPGSAGDRAMYGRAVEFAHGVATATSGSDPAVAAGELWDLRMVDEAGLTPLFDALDRARAAHVLAVRSVTAGAAVKATALRRVAAAYQKLTAGIATLVVESVAPAAEHLREVARETARLRGEVAKNESRIAELERRFATVVDPDGSSAMRAALGRRSSRETSR